MELATFDRFILFTKARKLLVVKSKATTLQCDGCFLYFRTNLGMHRHKRISKLCQEYKEYILVHVWGLEKGSLVANARLRLFENKQVQ